MEQDSDSREELRAIELDLLAANEQADPATGGTARTLVRRPNRLQPQRPRSRFRKVS